MKRVFALFMVLGTAAMLNGCSKCSQERPAETAAPAVEAAPAVDPNAAPAAEQPAAEQPAGEAAPAGEAQGH
ncbi:MAG: hypothetical protein HC902_11675 [Calothrix sp. SM1_5_4]|nr:hypothetical protein [Calothrix sp. SM1_5_4]